MKDFDLARPAACQRTSNGRRRPRLRRIAYTLTSNLFIRTPPYCGRTIIAALSAVAVTGCADCAARPYSQLSVGRVAAEQGADGCGTSVGCGRALHCGYDRGHAPG